MYAADAPSLALDTQDARYAPRLVAVGVDFHQAAVATRERLSLTGETAARATAALRSVIREGLILSTCNRTEVYALVAAPCAEVAGLEIRRVIAAVSGVAADDLRRVTTTRHGHDAVRHLLRVACGLESIVLGEPQILGQLRAAIAAAQEAALAGPVLLRLASDALRVGKKARTVTGIARNRLSIPHAAVELAGAILDGLAGRAALVVGAGEMGTLLAKLLRANGVADLTIANRTLARAQSLAELTGGRAIDLTTLPAALARADVVFGAISRDAGAHVVRAADLESGPTGATKPLFVDLGVPRCFDPALGQYPGVRVVDVDNLEPTASALRTAYEQDVMEAEALVESAAAAFGDWWAARNAAPAITALCSHAEAIREAEVARAMARLGHLSARDRQVVVALAAGLTNKLLHDPVTRMRDAGGQNQAIAAARTLFGISLNGAEPDEDHDLRGTPLDVQPAPILQHRRRTA